MKQKTENLIPKMKNEKGAITLFVLLAILFFLIVALSVYTTTKNKEMVQSQQAEQIRENYEKDINNIDEIYDEEFEEEYGDFAVNFIKKDTINDEEKEYYDINTWTNEDVVLEIILRDETLGQYTQITVINDDDGFTKIYTYEQAKNNEIVIGENCKVIVNSKNKEKEYKLSKFDKEIPLVSYKAFYQDGNEPYTSGTWTNKQVYTKIIATENISGIQKIEYSRDKQSWTQLQLGYSGGIKQENSNTYYGSEIWSIREERIEDVYFRVLDLAGNYSEPSNVFQIRYDTVAPTTPEITNKKEGQWVSTTIEISAKSTDKTSKIAKIQYSYDDKTWKEDWGNDLVLNGTEASIRGVLKTNPSNKIYVRAIDNAGNISKSGITTYKRDVILPTVSLSPNGGAYTMPTKGDATIKTTLNAADTGGSGLSSLEYAWSTSKTTEPTKWTKFTNGSTVSKTDVKEAGIWYLWTKVTDVAGNRAEEIKISNAFVVHSNTDVNSLITITPSTTAWTNKDVIGTVTYGSTLTNNKKAGYGTTLETAQSSASTSTAYEVKATQNGYFYAEATDIAGNKVTKSLQISNIDKTDPTINAYSGAILYTDPTFKSGVNSTYVYNNSGNGTVTVTRKAMSDNPEGSGYGLEIKTTGKASPGHGGFSFRTQSAANKEFVTRIVAKIPKGYTLNWATNEVGTGKESSFMTSQAGTGEWEEYVLRVKCGASGTFGTTNYFYLTGGSTATTANPVTWQVGYATVIDVTKWSTSKNIISAGKDYESGIVAYGINESATTEPTWIKVTQTANLGKISSAYTATGTHYVWMKDAAGNVANKAVTIVNIDRTAPTINAYAGASLYSDPSFKSGTNSIKIYNNAGGGTVTHTRKAMSDNPEGSGYGVEIKTTGKASPGHGGFYFATTASANKEFITRIVAKIPTGYTINWATNATGTGSTNGWLTSQAGTGKWQEYIFRVKCGSSGSFNNTNFFYLTGGSTATASAPVTWQLGYAQVIDVTKWSTSKNIMFAGQDSQSGIVAYGINQSSTTQPTWTSVTTTANLGKITGAYTATGTYYVWMKDAVGNVSNKAVTITNIDRTAPTVTLSPNGGTFTKPTTGNAVLKVGLKAADTGGSGLNLLQYAWSTSNTTEPTSWTTFTNNSTITKNDITKAGTWYLWTKVTDVAGNRASSVKVSNAFVIGNYTITITASPTGWTNGNVTGTITYASVLSQNRKAGYGTSLSAAQSSATATTATTLTKTATANGYFYAEATDTMGNKVTKSLQVTNIDKSAPTVKLSVNGGTFAKPTSGNATLKVALTAADTGGSGLNLLQYAWSTSKTTEPTSWTNFTNGNTISYSCGAGTYYLWTKVTDVAGNRATSIKTSNAFTVGNYTITITPSPTGWTNGNVTGTVAYASVLSQNRKAGYGTTLANAQSAAKANATSLTATANGYFYAEATDTMGNKVTVSRQVTNIDKSAPTVSLSVNGGTFAKPTSGNATIKTTLTASDTGGSGLNTLQYAWSTSSSTEPTSWTTFTNGATVSTSRGAGTYYLWTKVTDKAGNRASTVKVSKAFTVGNYTITISASPTGWTNGNVTGTVTYASVLSQNRKAGYGTTLANAQSAAKANATSLTATANGYFYAEATDSMGNKVTVSKQITNIDKAAPTVSLSPNGGTFAKPTSGNATIKVKLTASDTGGSGLKTLQYAWSTSSTTEPTSWTTFTSGSTISTSRAAGTYYLWTKVLDTAGNRASSVKVSSAYKVVASSITITPSPTAWTNGNVTATITYSSALTSNKKAGVGSTLANATNAASTSTATKVTVSTNNYYIYAEATDSMGNKVTASKQITNIDKTAPTVSLSPNGGTFAKPTSGNATIKVKLTASDTGGSGLKTLQYAWSTSSTTEPASTAYKTFTSGSTVSTTQGVGTYYLWTKVLDTAGNRASSVKVSSAYKVVTSSITITPSTTAWTNGNVTATITYSSALTSNKKAGVGSTVANATSAASTSTATKVTVSTNNYYIYAEATDSMGNKVTASKQITNIDKTAPTVSLSPNGGTFAKPTSGNATIKVKLTAADTGGSGLKTLQYAWSTSNSTQPTSWTNFTSGSTISTSRGVGTYYLWTNVVDTAGNRASSVKVSSAYKVVSGSITLTPSTTGWTNGNVTVTVTYPSVVTTNKKAGTGSTVANAQNAASTSTATKVTVTTNGYYVYAEGTDSMGNKISASLHITNIDKTAPTINSVLYYKEPVQSGLVFNLNGKDNTGNGHSTSTTTWADLSGNSFDGYISGAKWNGNALDFDGVDDYVTFDNPLSSNKMTYEVTISMDSNKGTHIMSNIEWGGASLVVTPTQIQFAVSNGNNDNIYQTASASVSLSYNTVYTVTGTFDGTTVKVYLDGALKASKTFSGTHVRQSRNTSMALGKNPYGRGAGVTPTDNGYFDGKMYAARMYNRALSASEVQQNNYASKYIAGKQTRASGTAQDTLSGITGYQFSTSSTLTASSSGWKTVTRTTSAYTVPVNILSGTSDFYLYIKDAAGNVTKKRQSDFTNYTISYNENYTDSGRSPGTAAQNYGNRLTGLGNRSTTTASYMKYSISNGVVTVTATRNDGYGFTSGRVFLERGHSYTFSCSTNGTWANSNSSDSVEAFLMLNGTTADAYYRMASNNYTFSVSKTGTYWLRLDVNQNGKTHTFSNIRIKEVALPTSSTRDYQQEYGVMPTPFRQGYNFDGWYTAASGGTKIVSTDRVTSSRTLYAHWSSISASITSFSAYVQGTGWVNNSGNQVGTTGQSKSINGIKITISPSSDWIYGGITYALHQADIREDGNWQWGPTQSGNTGKMGQAIMIDLGGKIAKHYDIYYKAHSQQYGWLGWAKNGEYAGTTGYGYRLEALKIQLVSKGSNPPTEDSSYPPSYSK